MISDEHQCIFVHIPKTGGVSIEEIIWPGERTEAQLWMGFVSKYRNKYQTGGLQHLLARQIRQEVGIDLFNRYFKFAFVRNPWDKAVSQYSFMAQRPDLRELIGMMPDTSFKDYLRLIQRCEHVQWQCQVDFLQDENGQNMVDFIGRFEHLQRDAQVVFERIGIRGGNLAHRNASPHNHYTEYYDDRAREEVRQLYAKDIEIFGYEFGRE